MGHLKTWAKSDKFEQWKAKRATEREYLLSIGCRVENFHEAIQRLNPPNRTLTNTAPKEADSHGLSRWEVSTAVYAVDDDPRYTYDSEGNEVDNDWLGY